MKGERNREREREMERKKKEREREWKFGHDDGKPRNESREWNLVGREDIHSQMQSRKKFSSLSSSFFSQIELLLPALIKSMLPKKGEKKERTVQTQFHFCSFFDLSLFLSLSLSFFSLFFSHYFIFILFSFFLPLSLCKRNKICKTNINFHSLSKILFAEVSNDFHPLLLLLVLELSLLVLELSLSFSTKISLSPIFTFFKIFLLPSYS